MAKLKDIPGQTFGRLTAVARRPAGGREAAWLCRCSCGGEKIATGSSLRDGRVSSCGCLRGEAGRAWGEGRATHGRSHTRLYTVWHSIRMACASAGHTAWGRYGGKGVRVDPAWDSFDAFLADVGEPPTPEHVLGRIDTGGDFCRGNCRWMTREERRRSLPTAVLLTHNGRMQTAAEWAKEAGLRHSTLAWRIRAGWTPKMAIETPALRGNRR